MCPFCELPGRDALPGYSSRTIVGVAGKIRVETTYLLFCPNGHHWHETESYEKPMPTLFAWVLNVG